LGNLEDKNKVEEVDSPPKTMKKQSKNKGLQKSWKRKLFWKRKV